MSEEGETAPNPSKILGLVGIFVASLVSAYLPSASAGIRILRLPGRTFFYAKHFGTGVILSTSLTHLLNAAFQNLSHIRWLGYKHWPGFFVMVSLMGIFFVEYASNAYLANYQLRREANHQQDGSTKLALPNGNGNGHVAVNETSPLLEDGSKNEADAASLKRQERILGVLVLQVGIMLHSFVIGLTMAVASGERFASLIPAIFFHQVFEGLALGVRLAGLRQPPDDDNSRPESPVSADSTVSTFQPTRTERILPPLLSILFALPIPLILFISLFIPALRSASASTVVTTAKQWLPEAGNVLFKAAEKHSRSEVMQGVTSAVSAGLLIYASCVELIAGDFLDNPEMQRNPASIQVGALVALTAGAVGMSVI